MISTKAASHNKRVVVVTGAGSGIGLATARLFATDGALVVVSDINEAAADVAVQMIQAGGGTALAIPCDVANEQQVRESVAEIVSRLGRIDVLINNAGRSTSCPAEDYAHWDSMIAVNLNGPFYWSRHAANASMIPNRQGVIVNISSLSGLAAHPLDCGYIAAKHGLVGLTKALALDWACYGIRVNCVCPGLTDTPILDGVRDERFEGILQRIPLRRAAAADDQARAIRFFCSEDAAYVTGAVLNVDGGTMALKSLFSPRRIDASTSRGRIANVSWENRGMDGDRSFLSHDP